MRRLKPLLTTLAVTGALAAGGAAIANAATSTTPSKKGTTGSGTTTTAPAHRPSRGTQPQGNAGSAPSSARSGSHNCPNM